MQLKNVQVVLVVLTDRGVNMDKKSLGYIIGNMGEDDVLNIVDKETGNHYKIDTTIYHQDIKRNKNVVTFYIKVDKEWKKLGTSQLKK